MHSKYLPERSQQRSIWEDLKDPLWRGISAEPFFLGVGLPLPGPISSENLYWPPLTGKNTTPSMKAQLPASESSARPIVHAPPDTWMPFMVGLDYCCQGVLTMSSVLSSPPQSLVNSCSTFSPPPPWIHRLKAYVPSASPLIVWDRVKWKGVPSQ
jgi:hypothetical protein